MDTSYLTSFVFIFAPVIGYVSQYRDILKTSNPDCFRIYTFTFLVASYIFLFVPPFFELLGTLSAFIEAMLGVPQLKQHYDRKSTRGFSYVLIGTWFIGDLFKTVYFYYTSAPTQFLFCGTFQLLVDIAITFQIMTYGN
eukprot:gene6267-7807_t